MATLLTEKIIGNYNSSLLRPHGKPIFLCFIEFSEAYCFVIKPYLLFVNGGLLVNSSPSPPFDICIYKCALQAVLEFLVLLWVQVGQPWFRRLNRPRSRLAVL